MFDNIGGKIKILAKIFAVVGTLGSVAAGLAIMNYCNDVEWIGLIVLISGVLGSLILAFLVYGFGHLILNSDIIASALNPEQYYYRQEYSKDVPKQDYDEDGI